MESSSLEIRMARGTSSQKLPRILAGLARSYPRWAVIWTVGKPGMPSLIGLDDDGYFAAGLAKIENCLHEVALDVVLLTGQDRFSF